MSDESEDRSAAATTDSMFPTAPTTAEEKQELLRVILPECQPQEGSPANTFTDSELQVLQAALLPRKDGRHQATKSSDDGIVDSVNKLNIRGPWCAPTLSSLSQPPTPPRNGEDEWRTTPHLFRQSVRTGTYTAPTNGVCAGYLQCNLVVLPAGKVAFDFLLFCQRNSQACPLLEVCEGAHSFAPQQLADGADLRTDIPKYAIYRNGVLDQEVADCTTYWPEDAVAFLIGCSFSYDGALLAAGIRLRSAEAGLNVPMYQTNLPCQPAGCLHGNLVVSMKPIHCTKVAKEVEITSKYKHAHGGPVCVGCPSAIGIHALTTPDWGDAIAVGPDEVPVFHACGVTPQAVLMASKVPFAITHAAGHMFVTDRPSDMGLL